MKAVVINFFVLDGTNVPMSLKVKRKMKTLTVQSGEEMMISRDIRNVYPMA